MSLIKKQREGNKKMTNFDYIKNMDIESFAMFLAMDRKRTIEDLAKSLNCTVKFPKDYLHNDFSAIMKCLESERDENV